MRFSGTSFSKDTRFAALFKGAVGCEIAGRIEKAVSSGLGLGGRLRWIGRKVRNVCR